VKIAKCASLVNWRRHSFVLELRKIKRVANWKG